MSVEHNNDELAPATHEEASSILLDRIDPRSTLPLHLQATSFPRDIWKRVKSHPIVSPRLKRDELADDADTRELIHAVIEAAGEREKEVLLHNQARVFQEILGRVLYGVASFLSTPMVPQTWNAQLCRLAVPPSGGSSASAPLWKSAIASMLTPQYILFAILALFGAVTGLSQLENYKLRQTIAAYESANNATELATNRLKAAQTENDTVVSGLRVQVDSLQNELREATVAKSKAERESKTPGAET